MEIRKIKLCLISSSGGHFEQLLMLKYLGEKYNTFFVTEKVKNKDNAKYFLVQDKGNAIISFFILCLNMIKSCYIFLKERPNVVITTGTKAALGMVLLSKLFKKKTVFIESFARVYDGTRFGKFVYKHKLADLFVYQWETLSKVYPDGVYGGSIY